MPRSDFFAHSGHRPDQSDWQSLVEHLTGVADRAAEFAQPFGMSAMAYAAGFLHDLGKYAPAFQSYLRDNRSSVDHSTAGAAYLLGQLDDVPHFSRDDAFFAHLIAACIAGHHAGLPDRRGAVGSLERRFEKRLEPLDPRWKDELPAQFGNFHPGVFRENPPAKQDRPFALSVAGRMVFSCLVDADFRDTEAFYAGLNGALADRRDWASLQSLLPVLQSRLDSHMAGLGDGTGALDTLRNRVLTHVRSKAGQTPGLFTLTVPTGGGKTLTSLAFALDHAKIHGHRRIIYAIPFTSIIEQTSAIFRQVLGEEVVVEHHASIEEESSDKESEVGSEALRQKIKLRQAREDWAAPVVVTTNVQFFESLFAARASRARKLHNIAGAVIILDEAQTIPRPLLHPALRMLEELATRYGCTVVLCTATQPAFDKGQLDGGLPLAGRELAPDPHGLARQLKRASLRMVGPMSNEALCGDLRDEPRSLIIVNSRKHALDLFRQAQRAGLDGLVHLTTRMCAAHRAQVLAEVRSCLKTDPAESTPCRVVATSLVEAGVDLDFPRVWRAQAGLDSLIQAAGRCNREGKRPLEDSIVKVFAAPDYPPPAEIGSLVADMSRILADHGEDLSSLAAIEAYFREVYWRLDETGLDAKGILRLFSMTRSAGPDLAYRTAAEKFRMIESGLAPVIVPFDETAKKAIAELDVEAIRSGALARRLQRYVVQVPPQARARLVALGKATFASPHLRGDQFCVLKDISLYRSDSGLMWEDGEYLSVEECMF